MINPEFTKRLSLVLGHGGGGWAPWYTFYMGAGAQISTRPASLSKSTRALPSSQVGNPFIGGALNHNYWNMYQAPGMSAIGGNMVMTAAFKNRLRDGMNASAFVTSRLVASQGDAPGMQHTAVAQNWYMNPAYDGDAKVDPRTPLVISELNPSVPLDPVVAPFAYETETTMEVSPEVTVSPNLESRMATALKARMSLNTGYEIGWDWSTAATGLGASYYPVIADNDMARAVSRDPLMAINTNVNDAGSSASSASIRTFAFTTGKSMLEVTDTTKLLRSVASVPKAVQGGSYGDAFVRGSKPSILRLGYIDDRRADMSTQFLCIYSGVSQGHNPVVSYMSGNKTNTVGIQPVQIADWYHQSMNYWGWSTDNTGTLTATSTGVRSPIYQYHTIVPTRSGLPGIGAYRIEGYIKNVIEVSLTNHLPLVGADGKATSYFKNGVFAARPETGDYEDQYEQINGAHMIQQPVAFPTAQEPEDPWLYYVSIDDEFKYHLNRQELGKAHISEELATLQLAPIQMAVLGGKVWMLFRRSIRVYDAALKTTTVYQAGLPQALTSIAVDREKAQIYVGHTAGVFNITTGSRVDVTLTGLSAAACVVGDTRLKAVNGYLTWITSADDVQSSEINPNLLIRVNTTTGSVREFEFMEFTGKTDMRGSGGDSMQVLWGFVASDLRSNGDLVVLINEAGPQSTHNHSIVWATVKEDGSFRRQFARFYTWERSLGNDRYMQSTDGVRNRVFIFRVDDMHYSLLNVPYAQIRRMNSASSYSQRSKVEARRNGYMGRGGAIGYIYATDIRIDDENLFILKDAKRQLNVAGTSNPGRDTGYTGATAWHDYMTSGDSVGSQLGISTDGYVLPGFNGVETRPVDLISAVNSGCVVILNKAYTTLFAGIQSFTQLGVELEWDGNAWVHGTAGKAMRSRTTHTDAAQISPWSQVAFSATVPVSVAKVHKVAVYPGCTRPKRRWYLYAGDLVQTKFTSVLTAAVIDIPKAEDDYSYMGIDYDRTDLMSAKLDGVDLTYNSNYASLTANQFYVPADAGVVVLHASAVGKTLEFTYSYVKAAV